MELNEAFESPSGLFYHSVEIARNIREKEKYKTPPSYTDLLKKIEQTSFISIEPISLDAQKAIIRYNELRTKKEENIILLGKTRELLKRQEEALQKFWEASTNLNIHLLQGVLNSNMEQKMSEFNDVISVINAEKKQALENICFSIEQTIQTIEESLAPLRSLLALGAKESFTDEQLQTIASGIICGICYTTKVNRVINSCGHTLCDVCLPKLNKKCHICRASFANATPIFFSGIYFEPPTDGAQETITQQVFDIRGPINLQ